MPNTCPGQLSLNPLGSSIQEHTSNLVPPSAECLVGGSAILMLYKLSGSVGPVAERRISAIPADAIGHRQASRRSATGMANQKLQVIATLLHTFISLPMTDAMYLLANHTPKTANTTLSSFAPKAKSYVVCARLSPMQSGRRLGLCNSSVFRLHSCVYLDS